MSERIYKSFIGKATEAWFKLSKEEQDSLLAENVATVEKVGGKQIVLCACRWSTEKWEFFGVEEYPSMEAILERSKLTNQQNWFRYFEARSTLGTEYKLPV